MITEDSLRDMQEWFSLLGQLGEEELSDARTMRMMHLEKRQRHNNFLGIQMAMMRQEYIKDLGYLALRIKYLDDYYALPWYRRIFSRPFLPR